MPFFKRKDSKSSAGEAAAASNGNEASHTNGSNGNGSNSAKEKINYKSRLEHKMYLVRMPTLSNARCGRM